MISVQSKLSNSHTLQSLNFYALKMCSHIEFADDENDAFYNELRRQVLLLISEDEETHDSKHTMEVSKERKNANFSALMQQGCLFNWEGTEMKPVPMCISNLWKPGNGTGVFIPCVSNFRQIYKPRRRMNGRRKEHTKR
ncbi:hypothetical protein LIER_34190 [Lithospermum erythrorhizon]|uniref:Uncharacterized protein n=1 Tax=Lithospermum erythrorhizon TaxID=34254 RepID=A0AAV3S2I1_LITER